jgi:hypothetical protein
MSCIEKAAKTITNDCTFIPRSGFEKVAYAINREDIASVTYDGTILNLVTAITLASGTEAYRVTSVKKEANGGFDLQTADDLPDTYLNYFSFKPYEFDAEAIQNIDQMQDIVIIAEFKGAKTEGCFVIYGLEKGLYKSAATKRQLDNNGLPIYEFASQEGQGERYSRFVFWDTDYATSADALEALTVELISPAGWDDWTDSDQVDDWGPYGTNTVANVGGTLVITHVDNQSGAFRRFWATGELGVDLVIGETYRIKANMRYTGGGVVGYRVNHGTDFSAEVPMTTSFADYEIEFVCDDADSAGLAFRSMIAGNTVEITTMELYHIP